MRISSKRPWKKWKVFQMSIWACGWRKKEPPPKPEKPVKLKKPKTKLSDHLRFQEDFLKLGSDPLLVFSQLGVWRDVRNPPPRWTADYQAYDPEKLYLWWSIKLSTEHGGYRERPDFFQKGINSISRVLTDEGRPRFPGTWKDDPYSEASDDASTEEEQNQKPEHSAEPTLKKKREQQNQSLPHLKHQFQIKLLKKWMKNWKKFRLFSPFGFRSTNWTNFRILLVKLWSNQARLMRLSEEIAAIENLGEMVLQFVEDNETSVRELRDQIQQVRMIEMGSIFTPMKRIVKDFAVKNDKKINLDIHGWQELWPCLNSQHPLVHLIHQCNGPRDKETQKREKGKGNHHPSRISPGRFCHR